MRTRAPSIVVLAGLPPVRAAIVAFCSCACRCSAARDACASGGNGCTATILAPGATLGTTMLTKKLLAELMSMSGQCWTGMVLAGLEFQIQCAPGSKTMAVLASGLRAVNLIAFPSVRQVGSCATVPANRQPLGTSIVAALIL